MTDGFRADIASTPLLNYGQRPKRASFSFPLIHNSAAARADRDGDRLLPQTPQTSIPRLVPGVQEESDFESVHRPGSDLALLLAGNAVVGADIYPKFRLNRSSASWKSQPWHIEDDPFLNQVLEQERRAWLAQAPAGDSRPDNCSLAPDLRSWTSISESAPKSPIRRRAQPSVQRCSGTSQAHKTEVAVEADASSVVDIRHNPNHAAEDFENNGNTVFESSGQLAKAHLRFGRKSHFQEGTMTEGSKGVASTWDAAYLGQHLDDDRCSVSDHDDMDGTPRVSAPGRVSLSSSIDIDEFKPLPQTPSTLKHTIKRLGQKLRSIDQPSNPAPEKVQIRADKPSRRGIRKSMSAWKLFNNSTSNVNLASNSVAETHFNGVQDASKTKTVRPSKSHIVFRQSEIAILDDRKRKAEIAYAEQFGTIRKRPRTSDSQGLSNSQLSDFTGTGTVKKRRASESFSNLSTKPRLCSVNSEHQTDAIRDREIHTLSMLPAPYSDLQTPDQVQAQSQEVRRSSSPHVHRLKKPSRRELEKENQRLRSMLLGEQVSGQKQTGLVGNLGKPECVQDVGNGTTNKGTDSKASGRQVHTHVDRGATRSQECVLKANCSSQDEDKASAHQQTPAVIRTLYSEVDHCDEIPPVPPLHTQLRHHKVLSPISGNLQPTREPMRKPRSPIDQHDPTVRLPRPLSMVLEGVEGDSDGERSDNPANVKMSTDEKQCNPCEGVADNEGGPAEKSVDMVQKKDTHMTRQQWQWPDDVF